VTIAFTAPPPGEHGGDGTRLAARLGIAPDAVLDLSVSLNRSAPDVGALVAAHASAVARYPDVAGATAALAGAMGVDADRLVLTNGGAEAIALVAHELEVGEVDDCEFSLYARHLREVVAGAPRWRSNPHNPTGRLAGPDERAAVWDEAFYPLATGSWTRGDVDSVVVGSLTKLFACPGLRIGYVLAPHAAFAASIRARMPRWSVNALACAVVPCLLERSDLETWSSRIAEQRAALVAVLHDAALEPDPSDACFVLVRRAAGVRDRLAEHAVLVRDTASFGIADGVRIAVPDAIGLDRLRDALDRSRS
jgi:histidinol-phosphate/aromatic aminotransferase/cobyric acid decarboxylase-like protein